jgi:hypothetical protein
MIPGARDRWTAFLQRRLSRPDAVRRGLLDLLWLGVAYSLSIALLALGGVAPGMPSWLAIPTEDYFRWEPLFTTPVIFFTGILAAAVLHLLARANGGKGTFERTLALVGPTIFVATLFTLVPDTLVGIVLLLGLLDPLQWMADIVRPSLTLALIWLYLLMYLAAFLVLFPRIGRIAHGLRPWPARWSGWLAFLVYQVVLLVFIR